jgi:hypothetical protein
MCQCVEIEFDAPPFGLALLKNSTLDAGSASFEAFSLAKKRIPLSQELSL